MHSAKKKDAKFNSETKFVVSKSVEARQEERKHVKQANLACVSGARPRIMPDAKYSATVPEAGATLRKFLLQNLRAAAGQKLPEQFRTLAC